MSWFSTKSFSFRHLNDWYACNAPYFYQLRPSAGDSKKYRSGQLFVDELPSNAVKVVYPRRGRCINDKLCFRSNQNWSCDTGICNRRTSDQKIESVTGIITKNCNKCLPLNDKVASEICKTKSIIAQKVIRFCDLDQIEKMDQDNLKTIFLFRDPRGIYSSRKGLLGAAETIQSVRSRKNPTQSSTNPTNQLNPDLPTKLNFSSAWFQLKSEPNSVYFQYWNIGQSVNTFNKNKNFCKSRNK